MTKVTFLGTGLLGSGMIEAMLKRGLQVTVWNRSPAKAKALEAFGAKVAATPSDAVRSAEAVHMALADDSSVDEMLARIAGDLDSATVVIDHTTTAPGGTKKRLSAAAARGLKLLHAPVFMSPQMCRDAIGLMMVSGPRAVFEPVQPHLAKMTGEVWYVGEREDLAAAYKIIGNSMLFTITAGIADVLGIAKGTGVAPLDASALFNKFKVGSVVSQRADKMARGDLSATFELTMARKDIRLMIEAAGAAPLAVLPAIARRMDEAIAKGHGKDDLGAISAL